MTVKNTINTENISKVAADYTSFGKCLHQTNGWHNQDRQACFICPSYEKWAALKK